jgi:hypothetical protein
MIQKDLSFTLFVTGDVVLSPRDEFGKFVPIRHGEVLHEEHRGSNIELVSVHDTQLTSQSNVAH